MLSQPLKAIKVSMYVPLMVCPKKFSPSHIEVVKFEKEVYTSKKNGKKKNFFFILTY